VYVLTTRETNFLFDTIWLYIVL